METNLKIKDEYDGALKIINKVCHKRILLILDDIDKLKQLKMLVGECERPCPRPVFMNVGPNPRECVESCYCLSK